MSQRATTLGAQRATTLGVLLLVVAGTAFAGGAFAVDTAATPDPVPFHDTVASGLSSTAVEESRERGLVVPRVEVFYSGYRYVAGYYGTRTYAHVARLPETPQRYGTPVAAYVTDLASVSLRTTGDGYLASDGDPAWVRADRAFFVVGSDAKTMVGPAVPAFGDRAAAEQFSDAHGGRVVGWSTVLDTVETRGGASVQQAVPSRHDAADRTVRATAAYRDRPVSTVVGRDAPTVQAAVDAAPPNSTVLVPAGTYEETVTVRKPITLRGVPGATIDGDDSGSAVTVRADRAAVVGLHLTGVGTGDDEVSGGWDASVENAYADGNAGVTVSESTAPLVADVTVDTRANGVLVVDSTDATVANVTVRGSDDWRDGLMGVMAIYSTGVVQDSTFVDGRDGVATHHADGLVVRNNSMDGGRFGVHLMYTSDALVANNAMRDQSNAGMDVMTRPTGTAVVGNAVTDAPTGIAVAGSRSYVARNVVTNATYGLDVSTRHSTYEGNVVYGNEFGAKATDLLASNRVTGNDFVANERHATSTYGALHVWTHGGDGNYWSGAPGNADGDHLDRSFSPTDAVGKRLATTPAVRVLADAPSYRLTRFLLGEVPGMRAEGIVDRNPLATAANPDRLDRARRVANGTTTTSNAPTTEVSTDS